MDDDTAVRGVVLAGGGSTRFDGGDKALAEVNGRPMLARVVDAVDAATDGQPILAVADDADGERLRPALGAADAREVSPGPRSVETVVDDPTHSGPLAGLLAAVDAADRKWLFVCACDMPLVTPASIEALRAAGSEVDGGPEGEPDAVVPVVDCHRQPLHALYRRGALDSVRNDLPETASLVALLDVLETVAEVSDEDVDASLQRATTNVNTRADLATLRDAALE